MKALTRLVADGHRLVTLLAVEQPGDGLEDSPDQPYVQFMWRDDMCLQIETQGDHLRQVPYCAPQRRMLDGLGYAEPYVLGEEYPNRTILRVGEGTHPGSAARCMIDTLWNVHGVHFHEATTARRFGVSHWELEWRVNPSRIDVAAGFRRLLGPP